MAQEKTFEEHLKELRSSLKWTAVTLWMTVLFSLAGIITLIVLTSSDDDDDEDEESSSIGAIVGFGINTAFAFAYAVYITILARRAKKYNGTGGVLGNHTGSHGAGMCLIGLLYTLSALATAIVGICTGRYLASAYFFFAILLARLLFTAGVAAGELKKMIKNQAVLPLSSYVEGKDKINATQSQVAFMPTVPVQQQLSNSQFQAPFAPGSWIANSPSYSQLQTQSQPSMQQRWQSVQSIPQFHPQYQSQFQPQFQPQQQSINMNNPLFHKM